MWGSTYLSKQMALEIGWILVSDWWLGTLKMAIEIVDLPIKNGDYPTDH